jgi:hypothetical protein
MVSEGATVSPVSGNAMDGTGRWVIESAGGNRSFHDFHGISLMRTSYTLRYFSPSEYGLVVVGTAWDIIASIVGYTSIKGS